VIGRKHVNLSVGWCGQFYFFLSLVNFQVTCEWLENPILIPGSTYFHCPGTTLKIDKGQQKIKIIRTNQRGSYQSIFSLSQHLPTIKPPCKMEGGNPIK